MSRFNLFIYLYLVNIHFWCTSKDEVKYNKNSDIKEKSKYL